MIDRLDIAIIGAGVGGLANAIALSRFGHRVTVYERFRASEPIGSGLMLQPAGLVALERLGLRDAILGLGHKIERLHGITTTGTTVFDLAYADLAAHFHALAVHRGALHGTLWSGFEQSGARLETGCTVATVDIKSGSRAAPVDESGRVLPAADLVIDATGARSPLRRLVSGRQARPFLYGAVWATVPDLAIAPATLAQRYIDAKVMIGYLPVGRIALGGPPLAAFFWSLKPTEYDSWRRDFSGWRDRVTGLWPELGANLQGFAGPDNLTLASYSQFTAERLSHGNLVLTGDSAHTTSPQLGQGANQALIDAVVLADAVAQLPDLPAALAAYEQARRRHVRFYQTASVIMTPFFQSDSWLMARLRDLTFDRMKIIPYLRREMIRTLAGLKTGLFTSKLPDSIVDCIPPYRAM